MYILPLFFFTLFTVKKEITLVLIISQLTTYIIGGGTIFIEYKRSLLLREKIIQLSTVYLLGNFNLFMNKYTEVDIANRKIVALVPQIV